VYQSYKKRQQLYPPTEEKATAPVSLRGGVPRPQDTVNFCNVDFSNTPKITLFPLKIGRVFPELNETLSGCGVQKTIQKERRRTSSYQRFKVCRKRISNG
jgi:hypothetical protein